MTTSSFQSMSIDLLGVGCPLWQGIRQVERRARSELIGPAMSRAADPLGPSHPPRVRHRRTASANTSGMTLKEYRPGSAFAGVIGRTFDVSEPAWPAPSRARE